MNKEINLNQLNTFNLGKWIKFESKDHNPKKYEENVKKLSQLVQNTPWFTKDIADSQLDEGDYYVFIGKDNNPHIAINFYYEDFDEVRGIQNNDAQEIEYKYIDVALSFLENNKEIKYSREWIENERWIKRLYIYSNKLKNEEKIDIKSLVKDLAKKEFRPHGISKNSNLEYIKKNISLIQNQIAYYYECNFEEIYIDDYEKKDNPLYKVIIGDVDFTLAKIKTIDNLKIIEGNAIFNGCNIKNINSIEKIGGVASFNSSKIKSFDSLKKINNNAIFIKCNIKSINNLEVIKGDANFSRCKIKYMEKLRKIDGDVKFNNSKIYDLSGLKKINGHIIINDSINILNETIKNTITKK